MLCDVSESQGKPGLAGSEQKPRRKPSVALPSKTLGGIQPHQHLCSPYLGQNEHFKTLSVCNLLHQSRKTVDLLSSMALRVPSLPAQVLTGFLNAPTVRERRKKVVSL